MRTQRHVCLTCIEDLYFRGQVESSPSLNFAACFYGGGLARRNASVPISQGTWLPSKT